jgi:hypothetical protein
LTRTACQEILDVVEAEDRIREVVEAVLGSPSPLEGLRAGREVRDLLSEWDSHLAREALAAGETWESIGAALGISRQAAWERLRPGVARSIQADRDRLESEKSKLREERARRWPTKKR